MPKNIALGDSSNHNMASAQIDIEPWKNTVEIDRFDFETVPRQVFKQWYEFAVLVENYLNPQARAAQNDFSYVFNYKRLYSHPDPNKKANARLTDLISGATTLHRIHTEEGNNPRREIDREAKLLGISRDELNKMYLGARSFDTLAALRLLPQDETDDTKEQ
jgi:capsid protein